MRVAYLIGNGFDLSLGLKTSPHDFLADFVKQNRLSDAPPAAFKLAKTIMSDGIDNWADFEKKLGEYSVGFNEANYNEYLDGCDKLTKHLHGWLKTQDDNVDESVLTNSAKGCLESLKDFRTILQPEECDVVEKIRTNHNTESWQYDIVSFNYTSALERVMEAATQKTKEFGSLDQYGRKHIYGTCVNVHENLNGVIVCGVDNPNQIKNEHFRKNDVVLNNIVKESIQRQLASKSDRVGMHLIENATIMCIFGMSMGISDQRWWKAIANRLKADQEAILIIYSYSFSSANPHTPYDRYRILEAEKSKFFDGAGLDQESREILKDRIFILKSSSILPISAR